mmetsp:Transcript_69706/g.197787  ORF Transcript_69706/g.197787 Transcript_69706/m.197787 type:complete len:249 (-) Transcript_69706:46-792(-)
MLNVQPLLRPWMSQHGFTKHFWPSCSLPSTPLPLYTTMLSSVKLCSLLEVNMPRSWPSAAFSSITWPPAWPAFFIIALSREKRVSCLCSVPSTRSSTCAMGHEIGNRTSWKQLTIPVNLEAYSSWLLPVKIAEGTISPNTSTRDTDSTTATQDGTSLSRNSGRASFATEFISSRVTSSLWWFAISGRTFSAATLSSFSLCFSRIPGTSFSSSPRRVSRSPRSRDTRPMVRPAASAAMETQISTSARHR